MHTRSLLVAAIVAAASLASAEPENRPKIYFPRHVKRQYTNHTITSSVSQSIQSDEADLTTHSSTKKDTISDLLSSLLGSNDGSDSTTSTSSASFALPTDSTSGSETESSTKEATKTSGGLGLGSTGGSVPPLISLPPLSLDLPSLSLSDASETASVTSNKTLSTTTATGGASSTVESKTNLATESTSGPSTTIPSTSSGILLAPTGVVTLTSSSSSSSSGGLIGGVSSLLGGVTSAVGDVTSAILPGPTANATESSTASASETGTNSDSGISLTLLPSTLFGSTTSFPGTAPTATASTSSSSSSSSSQEPLLSLTLPPILGTGSSSIIVPSSTPIANVTESSIIPTITSSIPVSLTASATGVPGNTTTTDSSSLPIVTSASVPVNVSISTTELPTTQSSTFTIPLNTTAPSTTSAESTTSESTSTESTSSEPTSSEPTTTSTPTPTPTPTTSTPTTKPTFTSVPVTATITDSESWLPTTIIVQPSTSTINTGEQPTATGIPSGLPRAITPWTQPPEQPQGSTLIQISFLFGENYQHLVDEPLAASQMFDLLPKGLAHGGGFDLNRVVMYSIRPYDTIARLGYITSQAMVYYPTDGISQLSDDIGFPTTPLYNHDNPLVRNLTSEINPAIGIMPGSILDGIPGSTGGSGDNPTDTDTPNNNDPFDTQGPGEETTSAQQGMTAGIAVGAASVAGAYGAAMFIIARRYKRKKQRHQRTSSITSPSEMRQTGSPALMGGALLSRDFTSSSPGYGGVGGNTRDSQGSGRSGMNNSARTANISAPVAAENSLGWN
ncbi:hypothetical protein AAE478_001859 [Parahypoxylon ruwenzoriense]